MEKLYFSIREVAEMLGVSQSLLRFWETEFDCIKPHKNKKGNRSYTEQDIEVLRSHVAGAEAGSCRSSLDAEAGDHPWAECARGTLPGPDAGLGSC